MPLLKYKEKRNFRKTPEPSGKDTEQQDSQLIFVVQRHQASHLHYDFRLELNGVLKSWAIPKGPPAVPDVKRFAKMVEDHPYDYKDFEGTIPEGNYGAGIVEIWDKGTYTVKDAKDYKDSVSLMNKGLKEGKFHIVMHGEKLKGEYILVAFKGKKNDWMIMKAFSAESAYIGGVGKKSKMPRAVKPMLATLVDESFDKEGWLFEIKWDGYRAIAEVEDGKVKLYSRNNIDLTQKYPQIVKVLESIHFDTVLDGELTVLDEKGRSSFQDLQNYQQTGEGNLVSSNGSKLVYYVFDILYLDGYDLTDLPLIKRKQILSSLALKSPVLVSEYIEKEGKAFFKAANDLGIEGIVAKNEDSRYEEGRRGDSWLKIKGEKRQEAVIAGFTQPRGLRAKFGALVLGVFKNGQLEYVGHTGSGFDEKSLEYTYEKLKPLITKKTPFKNPPKTNMPVTWVKPKILVEIKFSEWTKSGVMRIPIFVGLRGDKKPETVEEEKPNETKEIVDPEVNFTHINKKYWPDDNLTKKDLIDYYKNISDVIMPYLKDRPENLYRTPNGIKEKGFFQKDIDFQVPKFVKTISLYSESEDKNIDYLICQNKETLLYMANLGCVEINPWVSRIQNLDNPDFLILDLDPLDISFELVVETALAIKKMFDDLEVDCFCKTSGKTGLHILVPLGAKYTYEQVRQFAEIMATLAFHKLPEFTSVERNPAKREKKIYIDFLQNRVGQTLTAPYSVRPVEGAPVSTPLHWKEVNKKLNPKDFNIKNTLERIEKMGDIFKPVLNEGPDLLKILEKLK